VINKNGEGREITIDNEQPAYLNDSVSSFGRHSQIDAVAAQSEAFI
jgi:hypothetical protein